MKKFISIFLTFVMLFSCVFSITAEAAVRYDSQNPSVTSSKNHNMLNITGTEYYKAAFDCLAQFNTVRTGNGVATLPMDKELLDAAMLRARELSVYPEAEYRPNGERFDYIVDQTQNIIAYTVVFNAISLNVKAAADYMWDIAGVETLAAPEIQAAGIGCFKDSHGVYYWTLFISLNRPTQIVTAANYPQTKTSTIKIALRNDLAYSWNNNLHTTHSYRSTLNARANATKKTNGKITRKCTVCNKTYASTIYYPKTVTLSTTSYTYNGKTKKPSVTVKDSRGRTIGSQYYTVTYASGRKNIGKYAVKVTFKGNYNGSITKYFTINPKISLSTTTYTYNGKVRKPAVYVKNSSGNKISTKYYTVSYSSGRKNVGQYTVTVKFRNGHSGTYKKTFTIRPKSTSLVSLTKGSKKFTVKWKKQTSQTSGYQIQYSTSSKFSSPKYVTVSGNRNTSKTVKSLKGKKKYYVRVRTYKTVKVNGKSTRIYSSWSKSKYVTTKA